MSSRAGETSIQIVATPFASASTLFGLHDVLKSVGVAWEVFVSAEEPHPRFDVQLVAQRMEPFRCASGILVEPDVTLDDAPLADIVIVPGMNVTWQARLPSDEAPVFDWLVAREAAGSRITSACTGALYLAEAGLLDGREATTNWAYADVFRRFFPKVRLRVDRSICFDHSRAGIVTSGGTSAWHELVLFLITNYAGVEQATRAAKFWLMAGPREMQKAFAAPAPRLPHGDALISDVQAWVADNYAADNPVEKMTQFSGLPATTFARRFRNATGQSPQDYVLTMRVEEAKQILETSEDGVDAVGRAVGYEDPASFRRVFKRKSGLSPSEHRRHFGKLRFDRYLAGGQTDR